MGEEGVMKRRLRGEIKRGWSLRSLVIKVIKHSEIGGIFLGQ